MKIEKLKKSHKKQIVIGAVAVCVIGGALTFTTSRARYKVTESIQLATGTVNYKAYDFKIMAMYKSEDKSNYTEIEEMPSSGYVINESKSYCENIEKQKNTNAVLKTVDGNHVISKLNKNDRCYLYFDKELTASETILANATKGSGTPDFSKTSCTSGCGEATVGTYTVEDGMYGGTSIYWRGDTTDNYVSFANKCWRIVRINGDGSIRLIYDGTTCHANGTSTADSIAVANQTYNASYDRSEYVGWTYSTNTQRTTSGTPSNAKSQTDTWYNNNIGNNITYALKVADGKYCNDRNTGSGYSWSSQPSNTFYYAGYDRSGAKNANTVIPTLSCPSGDVYTLKAGAITMDEVVMAGSGKFLTSNTSYYLYNDQYYWTMTPSDWFYYDSSNHYVQAYIVKSDGQLTSISVLNGFLGLRPVINLKSDIKFSDGNGTQSSPYTVS